MEFLSLVLIIFGLIWIQNIIYRKYALKNLDYSCTLSVNTAFEGDEIELIETVVNKKWLPLPWLKSEITASRYLDFAGAQSTVSDKSRFVPSFFMVKSYQKVTRKWKVTCLKRGEYAIDKVVLVSTDLLGYSSVSTAPSINSKILILPRPVEMAQPAVSPRYLSGDIIVKRHLLEDPFYISGVREYTERDPMNKIHWAATAKSQRLMVYQNDYTSRQSVTVILNMQSREFEQFSVIDKEAVENAIRVAAGVFDSTLSTGMPMRFMVNGNDNQSRIPTVTGEYFGKEFVENLFVLLARLNVASTEDFGKYLNDIYHDVISTDIVLVTPYISEPILEFIRRKSYDGTSVRAFVIGQIPDTLDVGGCAVFSLADSFRERKEETL